MNMSVIKDMNHVAFNCHGKNGMDEVVDFYCDVLGLKKTAECYVNGLGHIALTVVDAA